LWGIFGQIICTLLFLVFVVTVVFGWCFIAYQIAWWLADETYSRVWLLIFLVIAPIFAYASKNAWTWLTPDQQAQAEYTADLLADKLNKNKEKE